MAVRPGGVQGGWMEGRSEGWWVVGEEADRWGPEGLRLRRRAERRSSLWEGRKQGGCTRGYTAVLTCQQVTGAKRWEASASYLCDQDTSIRPRPPTLHSPPSTTCPCVSPPAGGYPVGQGACRGLLLLGHLGLRNAQHTAKYIERVDKASKRQ